MKPIPALLPFSWLYGCGVVIRNLLFDWKIFSSVHVGIPVISVGNITTGGTGKTPVVRSIAEMLQKKNIRIAVVSRGYGRATHGLLEVSDGVSLKTTSANAGDEAFELALRLPGTGIVVDERRARGARYAAEKLNARAVVLDDGFQHRAIYRDLDIVLIDAAHLPFGMAMLPAGHRRDTLSSLKRAHAVLITKVTSSVNVGKLKDEIGRYTKAKIFSSSLSVTAFRRAKTGFSVDLNSLKGKQAVAFCGIAQPESFRSMLENLGVNVSSMMYFQDHHPYSDSDIGRIVAEQERSKAEYIVTTEKDLARLSSSGLAERYPLFCLEVEVTIHQEKEWNALIEAGLGSRKN